MKIPTQAEITADPDRILELYERCPKCGGTDLEALTFKRIDPAFVGIGCWECDWIVAPPGWTPTYCPICRGVPQHPDVEGSTGCMRCDFTGTLDGFNQMERMDKEAYESNPNPK